MADPTKTVEKTKQDYGASQIEAMEGIAHIRLRPGMYVGGTDAKAMHHLIYEVVDNCIDEALAGHCSRIEVTIGADESITVSDDGRGIPVDVNPSYLQRTGKKVSTLELAMTNPMTGGKFGSGAYSTSGGLHGVGVKATNALSSYCEVEVRRDGKIYLQKYKEGKATTPVETIGKTKPNDTGTTHQVHPRCQYLQGRQQL